MYRNQVLVISCWELSDKVQQLPSVCPRDPTWSTAMAAFLQSLTLQSLITRVSTQILALPSTAATWGSAEALSRERTATLYSEDVVFLALLHWLGASVALLATALFTDSPNTGEARVICMPSCCGDDARKGMLRSFC
jgi:hypothetical protein